MSAPTTQVASKECILCERELPLDDFYRKGAGHHSYCKVCCRDWKRAHRAAERAAAEPDQPDDAPILHPLLAAFLSNPPV